MIVNEIARCLFKPRWADHTQWQKALNAYARLSPTDQEKVEKLGEQYK